MAANSTTRPGSSIPDNSDLLSYPHSRSSTVSESPVIRSRTWSEDITKTWNLPITGLESLSDRVQRYSLYFQLTGTQMRCIYDKFLLEMKLGLEIHRANPKGRWEPSKCSLKMTDTCVDETSIPKGREKGVSVALDFGGTDTGTVRAVKVNLTGNSKMETSEVSLALRDVCPTFPKGLLDRSATASLLFDTLASLVKQLSDEKGKPTINEEKDMVPVGFSVCFPVEQRCLNSASLIHWVKGFETGRKTNDPVEGMDVAALLDCAFWRLNFNAKTISVLNDTTGTLLTCAYEKPFKLPSCRVGFILGHGVNGCYIQSDAVQSYGYKGCIINCELGNFDKSLPVNDVDLEVDFADDATKGLQLFEKMVSTAYLGELCRRLVVKVWQNEAPQLAWVRYSMPWLACARVIADQTPTLDVTEEIMKGLWEWDTTPEERQFIKKLFQVVFDRSAALASVAVVALASQTDRLQPAMGGLTCAIGGPLYSKCPSYRKKLQEYLEQVLNNNTSNLIYLHEVQDGSAKGAGILAAISV